MAEYIPDSGDIVWLSFASQVGHGQAGHRPAVVLSSKIYNQKSNLCLCVPMTSKSKGYPFEVECNTADFNGIILCDQIKSVDFAKHQIEFIAKVDKAVLLKVREFASKLIYSKN